MKDKKELMKLKYIERKKRNLIPIRVWIPKDVDKEKLAKTVRELGGEYNPKS